MRKLLALLLLPCAVGATSTTTAPAAPAGSGGPDTGHREHLELTRSGNILACRPSHPLVERVVVHAPGIDGGTVIVRVIRLEGVGYSVLLSAPAELEDAARRVTFFLRPAARGLILYELVSRRWRTVPAVTVPGPRRTTLRACTVAGLGGFWLAPAHTRGLPDPAAHVLLGGSLSRATASWALAVGVMAGLFVVSCALHRRQERAA